MEERIGFVVPTNPSVISRLLPAAKCGFTNNPSECARSSDTEVYDECYG